VGNFSATVGNRTQTAESFTQFSLNRRAARSLPFRILRMAVSSLRKKVEARMKMTINGLMKLGVALAGVMLAASFVVVSVRARANADDFDAAGTYKAKCFACHGAKAEKKWDVTRPEAEMVDSVLKGKKAEKPPNMPAFADKGITADQAKSLITYMKSIM
jgi:mono/diheme cytochrome c family protein